ncbi:MAG: hypothetical protein CMI62_10050 [Parvibaculum sp.]|jgi:hypothetical protein|uniref:hypothetical protein n=1 Tax=Parvibaculum sp. TaxID=2024848 RepID=UPI000C559DBD|nr:hypothetical protein [Parvibaculum sp.]MAU61054.1 hypothetical protein [Parvibaculum sp.]|tara:strand:- start:320 stop:901 length:582 start_codon:yes stop_codon:yes gene_type:complete
MIRHQVSRTSSFINRRQAAHFYPAVRLARRLGLPLNTHVTINFYHLDCPGEDASRYFERLRDNHFTRWLRYKRSRGALGGTPTYLWVIENPGGGHHHVHWALHIPEALKEAFEKKLPLWLEAVAGEIIDEQGAVHSTPIPDAEGLVRYLLKGTHKTVAKHLRVRHRPQGTVSGKRCGVSRNLGPAARRMMLAP